MSGSKMYEVRVVNTAEEEAAAGESLPTRILVNDRERAHCWYVLEAPVPGER